MPQPRRGPIRKIVLPRLQNRHRGWRKSHLFATACRFASSWRFHLQCAQTIPRRSPARPARRAPAAVHCHRAFSRSAEFAIGRRLSNDRIHRPDDHRCRPLPYVSALALPERGHPDRAIPAMHYPASGAGFDQACSGVETWVRRQCRHSRDQNSAQSAAGLPRWVPR